MNVSEKIIKLSKQLLPTGKAWKAGEGSNVEKFFRGLSISEGKAYNDAVSILDSLIPDNDNFSEEDATDWEIRLGMISNSAVPLTTRKLAILRKMAAPGRNPAKGHYLWIEKQLRDAGFDVYVHENIYSIYPNGYGTYNPAVLNPAILTQLQQGDGQQGDFQQGGYLNNVVVNSIVNSGDVTFNMGDSLVSSFFIGGQVLGTYASVPVARKEEFRQLILQLKQVQNVAILFINYV